MFDWEMLGFIVLILAALVCFLDVSTHIILSAKEALEERAKSQQENNMKRKKLTKKFRIEDMFEPIPEVIDRIDNKLNHFEKLIDLYQRLESSGSKDGVTEKVKSSLADAINTLSKYITYYHGNEIGRRLRAEKEAEILWSKITQSSTAVDDENAVGTTPEKSQK